MNSGTAVPLCLKSGITVVFYSLLVIIRSGSLSVKSLIPGHRVFLFNIGGSGILCKLIAEDCGTILVGELW